MSPSPASSSDMHQVMWGDLPSGALAVEAHGGGRGLLNSVPFHKGPLTFHTLILDLEAPCDIWTGASVPTVMDVTLPASPQVAKPFLGSESAEHIFLGWHIFIQKLLATHQCLNRKSDLSFFFFSWKLEKKQNTYY